MWWYGDGGSGGDGDGDGDGGGGGGDQTRACLADLTGVFQGRFPAGGVAVDDDCKAFVQRLGRGDEC